MKPSLGTYLSKASDLIPCTTKDRKKEQTNERKQAIERDRQARYPSAHLPSQDPLAPGQDNKVAWPNNSSPRLQPLSPARGLGPRRSWPWSSPASDAMWCLSLPTCMADLKQLLPLGCLFLSTHLCLALFVSLAFFFLRQSYRVVHVGLELLIFFEW